MTACKEIRIIRPKDRNSPVLAFADVSFANGVRLRDMRLMRGSEEKTCFLRMPARVNKSGTARDIYNPLTMECRKALTAAVADAWKQTVEQEVNEAVIKYEAEDVEPRFSDIHIYRFARGQQLKALAHCVMNGEFKLSRLAVMLDEKTKSLQVTMPTRIVARTGNQASYYQMTKDTYKALYEAIMSAYTAAG